MEWDTYHQKILRHLHQIYFLNNNLSVLDLDLECRLNEMPSQNPFLSSERLFLLFHLRKAGRAGCYDLRSHTYALDSYAQCPCCFAKLKWNCLNKPTFMTTNYIEKE